MSKREGTFVTLDELVDEVGADVTRFLFTLRSANQALEFDLDLARQQSNENPVYYVQYAHARCSSILRQPAAAGLPEDTAEATALLVHPAEQALIRHLLRLPEVIADSAERRETHELPRYAMEVANLSPNSEVSIYPWKEPKELVPQAVSHIRQFLRKHTPVAAVR